MSGVIVQRHGEAHVPLRALPFITGNRVAPYLTVKLLCGEEPLMGLQAYDDSGEIPEQEWEALRAVFESDPESCSPVELCKKLPAGISVPLEQVEHVIFTGWIDPCGPPDDPYEYRPDLQPVCTGIALTASVRAMAMEGFEAPISTPVPSSAPPPSDSTARKKTDFDPDLQAKAQDIVPELKKRCDRSPTKWQVAKELKKRFDIDSAIETIARRIRDTWSGRPNSYRAKAI